MTGLIILAAGSSSRLGQPKQKLIYKGKSLLRHAIDEGLASLCSVVVLVLGSDAVTNRREAEMCPDIHITINQNWEDGMASSIKAGISELLTIDPHISQAIIMLCDQPFVNADILNKLIKEKMLSSKDISACSYNNTIGTPVLFDRSFFPLLISLEGSQGAKSLVYENIDLVALVPFPFGNIDIDTIDDFEKLKRFDNTN
ncbi:nucleotidyltransferase family protein [Pedobacter sp. P351]|uniref:nucleotidyltransferase family protein n=1 Tax=Pedobacter superstes TaxID=3133441 RepID=UPI0030B5DA60